MAKKVGVAFVGSTINPPTIQEAQKVDNTDIINYGDPGVKFEGYSKVKISNSQYKLLRQIPQNNSIKLLWTGSSATLTSTLSYDSDKYDFYITDVISQYTFDTNCVLGVTFGSYTDFLCYLYSLNPNSPSGNITGTNQYWHFTAPFKVNNKQIWIQPLKFDRSGALSVTGYIDLLLIGWIEEKT